MNIFDFTIHYKKGSEMPADFLSQNVCEAIDVFDSELPQLQEEDPVCKVILDFIRNLDNPEANQNKPTPISSNTLKNVSFKMIFCGFDATRWREHQELFCLCHKF
jgi:hypothetical protein